MAQTLNALIYPHAPNVIVERRMIDAATIPQHKASWWRPIVIVGNDNFDQRTQKRTGPVITIEPSRVVETYTVSPLTAQEISDQKDIRLSDIDALQFAVSFDIENRVRALEGKAAVTAAQYRAALKARL